MDRGLGNTQGKLEVELSAEIQPASSWAGGDRKNRKRCSELRFYSVPSPSASYSAATSNGGASTGAATDAGYRSRSVYVVPPTALPLLPLLRLDLLLLGLPGMELLVLAFILEMEGTLLGMLLT